MTIYSYKMQWGLYMEGKQPRKCWALYVYYTVHKTKIKWTKKTVIFSNILFYSRLKINT